VASRHARLTNSRFNRRRIFLEWKNPSSVCFDNVYKNRLFSIRGHSLQQPPRFR
jgi:hypothetical protein